MNTEALDKKVADFIWSYEVTGNGNTTPVRLVKELHEALAAAVATASEQRPVEWVATKLRVPEAELSSQFSADVLLWFNDKNAPCVGYYDHREGYKEFQSYDDDYSGYQPTYWQAITSPATPPTAPAHV